MGHEPSQVRLMMTCRRCEKRFSITLHDEVELDELPKYPLCPECKKEVISRM